MVERRTEQLNTANRELATLFYKASHDFSAPLKTLLGLVRLCRMQSEDPPELSMLFDPGSIPPPHSRRLHTPAGRGAGLHASLVVEDNGQGIDPTQLEDIFDYTPAPTSIPKATASDYTSSAKWCTN